MKLLVTILSLCLTSCADPGGMLKGSGKRTHSPDGYYEYCQRVENKDAKECGQ